ELVAEKSTSSKQEIGAIRSFISYVVIQGSYNLLYDLGLDKEPLINLSECLYYFEEYICSNLDISTLKVKKIDGQDEKARNNLTLFSIPQFEFSHYETINSSVLCAAPVVTTFNFDLMITSDTKVQDIKEKCFKYCGEIVNDLKLYCIISESNEYRGNPLHANYKELDDSNFKCFVIENDRLLIKDSEVCIQPISNKFVLK
ncbi:MAG: hypothetical protein MHPSP_003705, partial [Paramarteilia canceri]